MQGLPTAFRIKATFSDMLSVFSMISPLVCVGLHFSEKEYLVFKVLGLKTVTFFVI